MTLQILLCNLVVFSRDRALFTYSQAFVAVSAPPLGVEATFLSTRESGFLLFPSVVPRFHCCLASMAPLASWYISELQAGFPACPLWPLFFVSAALPIMTRSAFTMWPYIWLPRVFPADFLGRLDT